MASLGALLSGYGSGSDSDSGRDEVVEDALGVSPSSGPESTAVALGALPGETRSLAASSQLPSGHNEGPERLTSRLPIRTALLAKAAEDSGDDDDEPKKRLKLTKGRQSILDTLPPPTQVLQATPRTQALHNDTSTGPPGRQLAAELPTPEPAESTMDELEQTAEPLVMGPPEARPAMATAVGGDVGPAHTGWYEAAEHAAWTGQNLSQNEASHHGPADGRGASSSDGDALLRAAIEAEENRAKKAGRPGLSGVQFKEVNADKLKQVAPGTHDGNEELRAALGPGYEAKLRAQAGPLPSKMAKRKHQIGSLYHAAKMRELDMMQARGQGLKSKAETQAKYGWA